METKELIRELEKLTGISMNTCNSSNIIAFGYDPKKKALWVVFHNHNIYKYRGISQEQFEDLRLADSKGKWVNANLVKPKVDFDKYEIV